MTTNVIYFRAEGFRGEAVGMAGDTPFFTLQIVCEQCGAVVTSRLIDIREMPHGAAMGEEDAHTCLAHECPEATS